ncbi:hypothetical protein OOT46_16925 [Aquabacterium sp. A7-Y]|uniref:hypothetical protein n=1 Tax=Aquabacterium sp. A7-Y TaxID=1349605 RepID=UPI00223D30C4|nr:hypothetical protein [Aquabacterium sp. A7-Y]MCW7539528.1 hypothetical protein [Aquabacterium sp. A7-Y]
MARRNQQWRVRLGEMYWRRFTHPRPEGDTLELLGSIERGAQIGALAVNGEGHYFQLNGDHSTVLSTSQVRAAVRRAEAAPQVAPPRQRLSVPAQPPVVIVKRRRVPAAV